VTVAKNNGRCQNDIIVSGFDVHGYVTAQSLPVAGVHLLLFASNAKLAKEVRNLKITVIFCRVLNKFYHSSYCCFLKYIELSLAENVYACACTHKCVCVCLRVFSAYRHVRTLHLYQR